MIRSAFKSTNAAPTPAINHQNRSLALIPRPNRKAPKYRYRAVLLLHQRCRDHTAMREIGMVTEVTNTPWRVQKTNEGLTERSR